MDYRLSILNSEGENIGIKGSFMLAAIGSDGIIVVTETRGVIYDIKDKNESPLAYYDGVQKEFIFGNNVFASTGKGAIGKLMFSALIRDFKEKLLSNPPIDIFFNVFKDYYTAYIPDELHSQIESNKMLVAGYYNKKPTIYLYQNSEVIYIDSQGYIQSDKSSFSTKYKSNLSCDSLISLATESIVNYSRQNNNWRTIGEEVCIIKITETGLPTWVKKINFKDWKYTTDLIDDYNNGGLKLNVIKPYRKKDIESLLKRNIK